jgi:hypothetical protein
MLDEVELNLLKRHIVNDLSDEEGKLELREPVLVDVAHGVGYVLVPLLLVHLPIRHTSAVKPHTSWFLCFSSTCPYAIRAIGQQSSPYVIRAIRLQSSAGQRSRE